MTDKNKHPLEANPLNSFDTSLTDLVDDIVYLLPNCSDLIIRKELTQCWRIFADRTDAYFTVEKVPLVKGTNKYSIPIPGDYTIKSVFGVYLTNDNQDVQGRAFKASIADSILNVTLTPGVQDNILHYYDKLAVEITLLPKRNCESIPIWILDKYGPAIVSGVIYRLASQKGKPWENAVLATQHMIDWENALNEVSVDRLGIGGEIDVTNYEGWA